MPFLILRRELEKAAVERAIADYYTSLSLEESAEHTTWGESATREFARTDA